MELSTALIVYVIIVAVVYFLLRTFLRVTVWSSLVLSLVVGLIFLSALCPISAVDKVMEKSTLLTVYTIIYIATTLLALFYIIERAFRDIDPRAKHQSMTNMFGYPTPTRI